MKQVQIIHKTVRVQITNKAGPTITIRQVQQRVHISSVGVVYLDGGQPDVLQITADKSFSAGRLIAFVAGEYVYYDPGSLVHKFALVGMSVNAANQGQQLTVKLRGEVQIVGWNLIPDRVYRAGSGGDITQTVPQTALFSQIVGRAKDSNTFIFLPQNIVTNA